jgi:hypothetical protein
LHQALTLRVGKEAAAKEKQDESRGCEGYRHSLECVQYFV